MVPRFVSQILFSEKLLKTSTTTKAREKISTYIESLEFLKFLDVCLTKFKNNKFYLI